MTHIFVSKLTIIGSDNGLSPDRRQAIIWTNAKILLIGPLGTHVSETLIEIHSFSFQENEFEMSSGKGRPFCLGLNLLNASWRHDAHTLSALPGFCDSKAIGHWWISLTNLQLSWSFCCCYTEQAAEQTMELSVIWDAMTLKWCDLIEMSLGKTSRIEWRSNILNSYEITKAINISTCNRV